MFSTLVASSKPSSTARSRFCRRSLISLACISSELLTQMSSDRAHKIEEAIHRRAAWMDPETDAWRLADGIGDGLPGIWLDDFAGRWLLSTDAVTPELILDPSLGFRSLYHKVLRKSEREAPGFVAGE